MIMAKYDPRERRSEEGQSSTESRNRPTVTWVCVLSPGRTAGRAIDDFEELPNGPATVRVGLR
jgi:hypothetical protein